MNGKHNGVDLLELFRNKEGFTSISIMLALLISLVLIFSSAQLIWTQSRGADVQSIADSASLSGANTVSKYMNMATVLDASVLSLGLVGMSVMGVGLVLSAIPPAAELSGPVLDAGIKTLEARSRFARSAYAGLEKVERGLPFLIAANSVRTIAANAELSGMDYCGIAIPFPYDGSDGSFSHYNDLLSEASDMQESSAKVKDLSDQAHKEELLANDALLRGWRSDCGDEKYSLYERAASLAQLRGALNPYYPLSQAWNFSVPLGRARAYYAARLTGNTKEEGGYDGEIRFIAREVYYEYAKELLSTASVYETEDEVHIDLPELPKNTQEIRDTHLYTDARWPLSLQDKKYMLHHSYESAALRSGPAGFGSFAELEAGELELCPYAPFSVSDIGRVAQLTSLVPSGFEYHWRKICEAAKDYELHKNKQLELEHKAKESSKEGLDAFDKALVKLAAPRPKLTPPGRYGVVAFVGDFKEHELPDSLQLPFARGQNLPGRAALSASCLVIDDSKPEYNILSQFFENLKRSDHTISSSAGLVLDGIFDLWGTVLQAYSGAVSSLGDKLSVLQNKANSLGASNVSRWISKKIKLILDLAGFRPVDLRPRIPVLVNTAEVFDKAGIDGVVKLRNFINALPPGSAMNDPEQLARTLGYISRDLFGTDEFELCEIPIPGTELSVPVKVKLSDLSGGR